jgi:Flp pilus assembly protein TadG
MGKIIHRTFYRIGRNLSSLFHRSRKRGQSLIIVAAGMMAFLGFGGLAIDVGMLYTIKNQLQQSLDMAAIRASVAMVSPTQVTNVPKLVEASLNCNPIMGDDTIDWPWNVTTTGATVGDTVVVRGMYYITPFFMSLFGIDTLSVVSTASAKLVSVSGSYCFVPYALPDWFIDANGDSIFQVGIDSYSPLGTGYNGSRDVGLRFTFGYRDYENNSHMGRLFGIDYEDGGVLSEDYPDPDVECHSGGDMILVGSILRLEDRSDGVMAIKARNRISKDGGARWNANSLSVENSRYPDYRSPRIIKVPVIDPRTQANRCMVRKLMSVFIEEAPGNRVRVVTMNMVLLGEVNQNDAVSFIKHPRLIR